MKKLYEKNRKKYFRVFWKNVIFSINAWRHCPKMLREQYLQSDSLGYGIT